MKLPDWTFQNLNEYRNCVLGYNIVHNFGGMKSVIKYLNERGYNCTIRSVDLRSAFTFHEAEYQRIRGSARRKAGEDMCYIVEVV